MRADRVESFSQVWGRLRLQQPSVSPAEPRFSARTFTDSRDPADPLLRARLETRFRLSTAQTFFIRSMIPTIMWILLLLLRFLN
jgi:hypothetical protein